MKIILKKTSHIYSMKKSDKKLYKLPFNYIIFYRYIIIIQLNRL
jgi:hypothetical protein